MSKAQTGRVRLRCGDCRKVMGGTADDVHRKGCDRCGGQLFVQRFGPNRRRRR